MDLPAQPTVYLKGYTPASFLISEVDLDIDRVGEDNARVAAKLAVNRGAQFRALQANRSLAEAASVPMAECSTVVWSTVGTPARTGGMSTSPVTMATLDMVWPMGSARISIGPAVLSHWCEPGLFSFPHFGSSVSLTKVP